MNSPFVLIAVFLLGCALGALLVSLRRHALMDRLKRDFQQQLEEEAARKQGPVPPLRRGRFDA